MAAARGLGCWVVSSGRERAQVSDRADLRDAVVCGHGINRWPDELLLAIRAQCAVRDGVHSLLRLITGRADAVVVSGVALDYEDLACLPVLVEEAGGKGTPALEAAPGSPTASAPAPPAGTLSRS
jgi:hypothetical protein